MSGYTTSNLVTCTRRLTFDAAHRVWRHESKCNMLHGHGYVVEIEAECDSDNLDSLGRVVDFSVLKERVGGWIERYWDHGTILNGEDHEARNAVEMIQGQKTYYLPYNPTAENMARYLLEVICPQVLHGTGVFVSRIVVHETENCKAEARF